MSSTARPGRLATLQAHLYGAGYFGVSCMGYVLTQWVMKFYLPDRPYAVNLVPVLFAPWIMVIGRVSDGLNDPVIGYLSDCTRTRWGRRKPFMAAGIPGVVATFLLVWHPPRHAASVVNFWYASGMLVLFFIGFTMYVAPYLAMLPEMAVSEADRLRLSALQGIYNVSGLVVGGLLSGVALRLGLDFARLAVIVAAVSTLAFMAPLFTVSPARHGSGEVTAAEESTQPPFLQSFRMTLGNGAFRNYVTTQFLFTTALLLLVSGLPYMVEQLLHQPEGEAGILTGLALVSGMLGVPILVQISNRRGVKWAYLLSLAAFATTCLTLVLFAVIGRYAWGIWAARAMMVIGGLPVAGLFALPNAMLADITDYDRVLHGFPREAMFFCVQGLILKLAYSFGPFLVTMLVITSHGDGQFSLSMLGPLAALLAAMAYLVFRNYPEDEITRTLAA